MNTPSGNNVPQSITEKASFLNDLREMVEIARKVMDKDESSIKKLYDINGTMVAQKCSLGADHMALKHHLNKELFLPISTPGGKKAVLIVKPKSTGSMAGAESYDVSIEGFLCQNPNNNQQVYGVRYNGVSMLTIHEEPSKKVLGSITLREYDDNFSTNDIIENEQKLSFDYKETLDGLEGEASYKLQRSNIKFSFLSSQDLDSIKTAIFTTKTNIFTANLTGGSTTDLASLFN